MILAFYTCFYGGSYNVANKIPPIPSTKYKCYYFTNNSKTLKKLENTKWIGVYDNKPLETCPIKSAMISKHVKICPHEYDELKNYSYLCFFDSKTGQVNDTFVEDYINKYFVKQNYALLTRTHPFILNSIWDELNEVLKNQSFAIYENQYTNYINNQLSNGLKDTVTQHCAAGFLIKNMKHDKMIELSNTWYSHVQECGNRDQLSFFFVKQLFDEYIHPFDESPIVDRPSAYSRQKREKFKRFNKLEKLEELKELEKLRQLKLKKLRETE